MIAVVRRAADRGRHVNLAVISEVGLAPAPILATCAFLQVFVGTLIFGKGPRVGNIVIVVDVDAANRPYHPYRYPRMPSVSPWSSTLAHVAST